MAWLAALFTGGGIGLLISPAFRPELAGYNLLGFIAVAIGWYFTNKVLSS